MTELQKEQIWKRKPDIKLSVMALCNQLFACTSRPQAAKRKMKIHEKGSRGDPEN